MSPDVDAGISVATWNLHGGVDGHGRTFDVVASCAALDADLLALQEVVRSDGEDLATLVAASLGYEVVTDTTNTVTARVALLARDAAVAPDGLVPLCPAPSWCGPRAALRATVRPVALGADIDVTVVHLAHRPDVSLRQLRVLRRSLPTVAPFGLLLGDYNLWGAMVRPTLPGWRTAARGATWPAHRPHSQIDHVMVRGPLRASGAVQLPSGSDHRALRATLVPTRVFAHPGAQGSFP